MRGFVQAAIVATAAIGAQQAAQGQVVVWPQPAPIVWGTPVVAAPVVVAPPVHRVYRRPVVVHQRVPHVTTRHRPVLGGTVSRVHYRYRPVFF